MNIAKISVQDERAASPSGPSSLCMFAKRTILAFARLKALLNFPFKCIFPYILIIILKIIVITTIIMITVKEFMTASHAFWIEFFVKMQAALLGLMALLYIYSRSSEHIDGSRCRSLSKPRSDDFCDRKPSYIHVSNKRLNSIGEHNKYGGNRSISWRRKLHLCGHQQVWDWLANFLCDNHR